MPCGNFSCHNSMNSWLGKPSSGFPTSWKRYIPPIRNLTWYRLDVFDQEQIFVPTLQISGSKTVVRTRHYGPKDGDYFWFLHPNIYEWQHAPNMLEFQQTLQIAVYCPFNFKSFPFDNNYCDFTFGSVNYRRLS